MLQDPTEPTPENPPAPAHQPAPSYQAPGYQSTPFQSSAFTQAPSDQPAPSFPHRPARSMATAMLAAGLVIGSIAGGAIGATLISRQHTTTSATNVGTTSATSAPLVAAPAPSAGTYAAIYQQDKDGVVTISTQVGGARSGQAEGSGVVVDAQGDILTNAHVVSGATDIQVTFSDGSKTTGTVKGVDQSADLAVVKVTVSGEQTLHPLPSGNSDALQVGDTALAIGTPFGLQGTFTAGIISGLNRTTTAPNGRALSGMIQTDAPINPGNSGGALLDGRGQLVGINDSIQSPVEGNVGVGFAIPINRAKQLLPSLEQGVAIQHPWLGISGETLTSTVASQYGLKAQSGVLVVSVVGGGPAQKAGLRATGTPSGNDDVITAIDGHALSSIDQLTQYLDTKKVGDKVTLAITRGSQHLSVQVTLGNFVAPSATP